MSKTTTHLDPGIGAGTKEFDKHPNILRVIVGDVLESPKALAPAPVEDIAAGTAGTEEKAWTTRQLWMLETNIDDMSGEVAGYLMEKLLAEGSLDAWVSPALMKKSRPAYTVHVLCEPQDQERFIRLLFVESTTLGVRRYPVDRCSLRREMVLSPTVFGDIPVKVRLSGYGVMMQDYSAWPISPCLNGCVFGSYHLTACMMHSFSCRELCPKDARIVWFAIPSSMLVDLYVTLDVRDIPVHSCLIFLLNR